MLKCLHIASVCNLHTLLITFSIFFFINQSNRLKDGNLLHKQSLNWQRKEQVTLTNAKIMKKTNCNFQI